MSAATNIRISKRIEKELHQKKVVIRRLPPDFTEEKFLETVNPLPSNSYFYFAPGDSTLGVHGCCRAYITFDSEADILPFRDQYDGLILESEKGTKYRIAIEYAPFQGVPKKSKRKPDTRIGTIEQDADYKAFLEAYEATEEPVVALDLVSYLQHLEATKPKEVQSTPLTEYLDRRGIRSRKGRSSEAKRKKGESSKGKGKGFKEDSKSSKGGDENSRDSKHKERGRRDRDKPSEPPRLITKNKRDEVASSKSTTQWSVIEPSTSTDDTKDSRRPTVRSDGRDRHNRDDKGEGHTKNRDRPDRAFYLPRRQSHDDTGKSEGPGKYRDEGGRSPYQGRSQRYKGGGRDDGEYRQREDRQSGGRSRDRGRGPRDRQKQHRSDFKHES